MKCAIRLLTVHSLQCADNNTELKMEMMRSKNGDIPLLTFFLQSGYFEKAEFLRFQISALRTQRRRFLADKRRAEQIYGKRRHLVRRTASRWHATIVAEYFKNWRTWSRRRMIQRRKINRFLQRWRDDPLPRVFAACQFFPQ